MTAVSRRVFQREQEAEDVVEFVDRIRGTAVTEERAASGFFASDRPVAIARAPGRLDVLGGIADYSGSLVLPMPIAEATLVGVQTTDSPELHVRSLAVEPLAGGDREFHLDRATWTDLERSSWSEVREWFREDASRHWAAYVLGPILVLLRSRERTLSTGLRLLITSRVPEGKGVSSSAALEVATMLAVAANQDVPIDGEELARLCQTAENEIVGAPCGLMDPMASALGRADHVLELLCQPGEIRGLRPLPTGLRVWGIDSGVRHAVTGSDYKSVRTAAFMGQRILQAHIGRDGYLANVGTDALDRQLRELLPETMTGAEFLRLHGGTVDSVTRVETDRTYRIRASSEFPIREHERATRFAAFLHETNNDDRATHAAMGELLHASHDGYSACGLGCEATDRIVSLVLGQKGLHGARITGGGSGGTVAVLGEADAGAAVEEVAAAFARESGHDPVLFEGSSPGAFHFGVIDA